jgi:gas vesicle protein
MNTHANKDFMLGALVGAFAGAVGGILLAPKSGEKTRRDIKNSYMELKEEIASEIMEMKDISKEKYNKIVSGALAGYKEAKKITPQEARRISKILDDSFEQIVETAKEESK